MSLLTRPLSRARDSQLQAYNSLVLQHQDEAFSLACDLLGEESAAAALVQQVFLSGFGQRTHERLSFRLRALRWVVRACLARGQALAGPARMDPRLAKLSNEEKVALVLVERLGLNYPEAAAVVDKSVIEIRAILGTARMSLWKMS